MSACNLSCNPSFFLSFPLISILLGNKVSSNKRRDREERMKKEGGLKKHYFYRPGVVVVPDTLPVTGFCYLYA